MTRKISRQDAYIGLVRMGMKFHDIARGFTACAEDPELFPTFEAACIRMIREGRQRIGGMDVINFIRFDTEKETHGAFKCNNTLQPFLTRLFVVKWPEFRDRFEFRATSRKEAA